MVFLWDLLVFIRKRIIVFTCLYQSVSVEVEIMDSDEDDLIPVVTIGDRTVPVTEVNDTLIAQMTPAEKDIYIHVYQDYYAQMYD